MLRLGLVCDFAEEGWTSMDLVGDMLLEQLQSNHGDTITADRLQPPFRHMFQKAASAPGALRSSHRFRNADRFWNRMVEYPRWLRARAHNYDVFHILDHSYSHLALALPPGRTVITCHDLDAFRCLSDPAGDPRPLWFRAMAQRILNGLRSARHVIFVSEAVRQEADRLGLISESRSSVVHNGADFDQKADSDAERLDAERRVNDLLGSGSGAHSGGGDEPLLLSVGSTIPRKRMDLLLRVFAGILNEFPGARLIRIGGPLNAAQRDLARQLCVSGSVVELPFIDRAVLGAVYRRATLLLEPSDAEGFGLPVVEAMAHGCPVVASDIAVLREIGGDAAAYCPAGDLATWSKSVAQLLHQRRSDPAYWSYLRSQSIANAGRFSWRRNADAAACAYQAVYQQPSGEQPSDLRPHRTVVLGHAK